MMSLMNPLTSSKWMLCSDNSTESWTNLKCNLGICEEKKIKQKLPPSLKHNLDDNMIKLKHSKLLHKSYVEYEYNLKKTNRNKKWESREQSQICYYRKQSQNHPLLFRQNNPTPWWTDAATAEIPQHLWSSQYSCHSCFGTVVIMDRQKTNFHI